MEEDMRVGIIIRKTVVSLLVIWILSAIFCPLHTQAASKPKLNKKTVTLTVGKSVTLKVSGGSGTPKWSVSDSEVLSLKKISKKKYKITALKAGKAKVKVKRKSKKASCTVTVNAQGNLSGRNPVYTGISEIDYLLKLMSEDAGVDPSMDDETIVRKLYKWLAKHGCYYYETKKKYSSSSLTRYYDSYRGEYVYLKPIYKLKGKKSKIAAYKEECDARHAAGEIAYDASHIKYHGWAGGDPEIAKDDCIFYYSHLSGTCSYFASMFTLLCERMGLKAGEVEGSMYTSKKKFEEHTWSWVRINGKKCYIDIGSAVHTYTRRKKLTYTYYKLSKKQLKNGYRKDYEW